MYLHPPHIELFKRADTNSAKFSILIPSWNNLPYLQLCINSIRKNSSFKHQVIVHVNEGRDGTLEWIKNQPDIDYSRSDSNIGVCYALNTCRSLAVTDYIVYMNDDMYACPGWDKVLYDEVQAIGHKYFFLSSTAIEPGAPGKYSIAKDFGRDINSFEEEKLLQQYQDFPLGDWMGATWPPNIVHKDIWDLIGGYSIEFSPGMYSDPDFSMKLWQTGVRLFKGVSASRVYHFGSKSVSRIKKNKGYYAFINKWGITSSTLTKLYLRRGEPFTGLSQEPAVPAKVGLKNLLKQVSGVFNRK